MKRIVSLIAILAILYSCNDRLSDDIQKDDLIPVKLSLVGEVVVDEEPLTKVASSNDFIAIQVYQDNVPYAYGIFEDASNLSLYLHSERNYSFKVMYIKDGKDKLILYTNSSGSPCYYPSGSHYYINGDNYYTPNSDGVPVIQATGDYYTSYGITSNVRLIGSTSYVFNEPYSSGYCVLNPPITISGYTRYGYITPVYTYVSGSQKLKGYQFSWKLNNDGYRFKGITNQFIYDEENWMSVSVATSSLDVDRFYGEGSFLSVSGNGNTVTINMKHLVYSIQCNVTGVSDGTASITIKRDNTVLLNKTDISGEYHSDELYFTCSDWSGAWQYSDNYTENITVSMTWLRGVGVLQDLGSQVVQVKRNCKNVINVSLSTSLSSPAIIINQDE